MRLEGNDYVVVDVLAAGRGGVRVLDAAEVADERQAQLDQHRVLLVAIDRIGRQRLRNQLQHAREGVLEVKRRAKGDVGDKHVQEAQFSSTHLLVAGVVFLYGKRIAHKNLQNRQQENSVLGGATPQSTASLPLYKQRDQLVIYNAKLFQFQRILSILLAFLLNLSTA